MTTQGRRVESLTYVLYSLIWDGPSFVALEHVAFDLHHGSALGYNDAPPREEKPAVADLIQNEPAVADLSGADED